MSGRPNSLAAEDRRIRMAAESVLHASMPSPRTNYPQSAVVTPDALNDILIAGIRRDGGLSNVRRFFCLFVTFDFFFTLLLWMICIVFSSADVQTAFVDAIVHYRIQSSLFDVVVVAGLRLVILLLFYAILHVDHWSIVALTTMLTYAFLLTKVFLYVWPRSEQALIEVILILTSFVLAWGEIWFLDLKVVPQESLVRDWYSGHSEASERAPLLGSSLAVPVASSRENVGHFYTPMDSPDHSEDETTTNRKDSSSSSFLSANMPVKLPQDKIEKAKKLAQSLPKKCYDILTSPDWKVEKTTAEGDVISYMHLPKPDGKIFKITAKMAISAQKLMNDLFNNIESNVTWNKQVSESKIIYVIEKNIDFVYQGTAPLANGTIGPRDFIILRINTEFNSYLFSAGSSVDFTVLPTRKNFVRGENGVGCYVARALDNDTCEFTWVVNTHLKGWLPQKMVDLFMPIGMAEFIESLRVHVNDLK